MGGSHHSKIREWKVLCVFPGLRGEHGVFQEQTQDSLQVDQSQLGFPNHKSQGISYAKFFFSFVKDSNQFLKYKEDIAHLIKQVVENS